MPPLKFESGSHRWPRKWICAAPGPSLTQTAVRAIRRSKLPVIAVQDAYRLLTDADVLYGCDAAWWRAHDGAPEYAGYRWSSNSTSPSLCDDKTKIAERFAIRLIEGRDAPGFSLDPGVIHYGDNSGFQAINLALNFGAHVVYLVGFDMRSVDGHSHFFGDHELPLRNVSNFERFVWRFEEAARLLPERFQIFNATAGSAITCWPTVTLEEMVDNRITPATPHRAAATVGRGYAGREGAYVAEG